MTVPVQVNYRHVADFLRAIGLDPERTREVLMEPGLITATMYRNDESGQRLVGGVGDRERAATETYEIRIEQ